MTHIGQEKLLEGSPLYVIYAIREGYPQGSVVHDEGNMTTTRYPWSDKQVLSGALRELLAESLPSYMVPDVYLFLDEFPLTVNGKVDTKALPDVQQSEEYVERTGPRNEVERQLCEIWQEALNLPEVGIEDNFFAMGGDSIVSIQVVSRAKRQGLHFTVRELFDHQTIAKLSKVIGHGSQVQAEQSEVSGELTLLPVQRAFFEWQLPVENHYNQSVLLVTPQGFDDKAQEAIVRSLYQRHDALRLRFDSQKRSAMHVPFSAELLVQSLEVHDFRDISPEHREAEQLKVVNQAQASLDIGLGPVFKAVYMEDEEQGRLLLVVHHLVVDGVSWRILLSDLETAWKQYRSGEPVALADKSSSLQQWGEALKGYVKSHHVQGQKDYWREQLSQEVLPLPVSSEEAWGNEASGFTLDEESTRQLLGECNDAYRTRINELLLCGFLMAYRQWSGQHSLRLLMEGHGREELFEHLDVSDTVGWFTSLYPLILSDAGVSLDDNREVGELIKQVKEQYRAVPDKGMGYGLLRYLDPDSGLEALEAKYNPAQIEFNYLGQFDNTINQDSAFVPAKESAGANSDPVNPSSTAISVMAMISKGCLQVNVEVADNLASAELLTSEYSQALNAIISTCLQHNLRQQLLDQNKEQLEIRSKQAGEQKEQSIEASLEL
ncbi:hypothetical protein KIH87_10650 [Paraneptunicella aestuarii]|uniref:condensation domain-containing protein n=1 Tax=Paraneptunicella aestuarii TaxID=2831148 RepID=UPI001E2F27DF|nr:condensation domain-containing protein [Paraneptunicella aestuarii]UAA37204.1 hypothetical protein KIH87_10650 [Paraneptunicella aestuarii]